MLIYWLLFAVAAVLAFTFPTAPRAHGHGPAQGMAFAAFLLAYVAISSLRYEVGGDWVTYDLMYDAVAGGTLTDALTYTDPGFGLLLYVCAKLGLGIYPVNGFCSLLIGYGTIRVAMRTPDPWLGIIMALPYMLIVVGMGYIRQAAAIGWVLMAIAALGRGARLRTLVYLALGASFHSTAGIVFPLFGFAMAGRSRVLAVTLAGLGALALYYAISAQLQTFQAGYLDYEYQSGGALPRQIINVVPSLILLLRWRRFVETPQLRLIWIGIALANVAALIALGLSPSSTAVDRIALYFSIIQIAAFGQIRNLVARSSAFSLLLRLGVIGAAGVVQSIWLIFATHAQFWVPYKSVFDYL